MEKRTYWSQEYNEGVTLWATSLSEMGVYEHIMTIFAPNIKCVGIVRNHEFKTERDVVEAEGCVLATKRYLSECMLNAEKENKTAKTYCTKRALIKGGSPDPIILWFDSIEAVKTCVSVAKICGSESELAITDGNMKKHTVETSDAKATMLSLANHTKTVIEEHIIGSHKFTFDELVSIAATDIENVD